MGRSTSFLILALLLLFHCFSLLSAYRGAAAQTAVEENDDFANDSGADDVPANNVFFDYSKKNGHGGGKKHPPSHSIKGRKARGGKNAAGTRVGPGSSTNDKPVPTHRPELLNFSNKPVMRINHHGNYYSRARIPP